MILNINKPTGISSHAVVNRVRRITNEKRVGHGGTLDPLASGVLIVGVGRESTRKLEDVLKNTKKEYVALIELGKKSETDDSEGPITSVDEEKAKSISKKEFVKVLKKFKGKIRQTPPYYSAVKIAGKPAYKLSRSGRTPEIPEREIHIYKIKVTKFSPPQVEIRVLVSSGAYIRSLARDIGNSLGTGAYLRELERTRVGKFTLRKSQTLDDLEKDIKMVKLRVDE